MTMTSIDICIATLIGAAVFFVVLYVEKVNREEKDFQEAERIWRTPDKDDTE